MARKGRKRFDLGILSIVVVATTSILLAPKNVVAQLADTPWPMFSHDLQHTGRSPYLGAQEANLKWSLATGGKLSSPAIDSNGTIYVGSYGNALHAINPDGTFEWSLPLGWSTKFIYSSPAIGSDGTIYVGSCDGNLHAINPDGTLKWKFQTRGCVYSSPAIDFYGNIYVGSFDNNLYAINPDGTIKWKFSTGYRIYSSPAIGADGTIYVGSLDKHIYAINPDGSLKWKFQAGRYVFSSPAIGPDGTIYVGSHANKLYAINPTGTAKWSFGTEGRVETSPAIGSDGIIYVGSGDYLYAIYSDGSLKWKFQAGGYVFSSPAIGSDGIIYVGSGGYLYAINPDGSLKWNFQNGDPEYYSPSISPDGTIYVHGNGVLYAIGPLLSPPLAIAEPGLDVDGNLILDGSKSYDTDGEIVSFEWFLKNRDLGRQDFTHTGEITSTESVDVGIYDVTLTVTDNDGLTGTDTTVLYLPAGAGMEERSQATVDMRINREEIDLESGEFEIKGILDIVVPNSGSLVLDPQFRLLLELQTGGTADEPEFGIVGEDQVQLTTDEDWEELKYKAEEDVDNDDND